MNQFDDKDTVSAPVDYPTGQVLLRNEPVVGLRVYRRGEEHQLPLRKDRFTVGNSSRCDVEVDDRYASKRHCTLERRGGKRLFVHDRRSKNGTYVNGNRIESAELRVGSILKVGRTKLIAFGKESRGRLTAIEQLLGEDLAFRRAIDTAVRAATSNCSVLILGETGTGKDLVARAIHDLSPRAAAPFVAMNCGAIPRELIGSELFGHEQGAFTGALRERDGYFVQADGGTLFLDELGELPLEMQPHLLRVLESHVVRRVGGSTDTPVDVRVVAATNRSAGLGTEEGSLRVDLYHRLATVIVKLPPLRQRTRDIPILVRAFMKEMARTHGPRSISRTTLRALERYPWPGNVRELRYAIQRAMTFSRHELSLEHLLPSPDDEEITRPVRAPQPKRTVAAAPRRPPPPSRPDCEDAEDDGQTIDQLILDRMLDALDKHHTIRAAARAVGMPKSTFADRMRRYRNDDDDAPTGSEGA